MRKLLLLVAVIGLNACATTQENDGISVAKNEQEVQKKKKCTDVKRQTGTRMKKKCRA